MEGDSEISEGEGYRVGFFIRYIGVVLVGEGGVVQPKKTPRVGCIGVPGTTNIKNYSAKPGFHNHIFHTL